MQSSSPENLVISTLPPKPCGIAAYAAQYIQAGLAEGKVFRTISLTTDYSGADAMDLNMQGRPAWTKLWKFAAGQRWGLATLNYSTDFFRISRRMPHSRANHLKFLALMWTLRLRAQRLEIIIHEFPRNSKSDFLQRLFDAVLFASVHQFIFHTDQERNEFLSHRRSNLKHKTDIRAHEQYLVPHSTVDQKTARAKLEISRDAKLFLCIGFLQSNKGFDAAVDAFNACNPDALNSGQAELWVVGDCRTALHEAVMYKKALLDSAARSHAHVNMRAEFVDDEEFDLWICAADYIILPYREIWSSGIAARASLYDKPVIARKLPGLVAQLESRSSTHWFGDDGELPAIFETLSTRSHTKAMKKT